MDNHVTIYGSKVAEGFSAFQRPSCIVLLMYSVLHCLNSLGNKFTSTSDFDIIVIFLGKTVL